LGNAACAQTTPCPTVLITSPSDCAVNPQCTAEAHYAP
jgi:hypothetical protein